MEELPKSEHHIRNSGRAVIIRLILALFLTETVFAVILAALSLGPDLGEYFASVSGALWLLQTAKFFVNVAIVILLLVPWASTNYYLNSNELIRRFGLLGIDEKVFQLANLKEVSYRQGFFGRFWNYGDLILTFSAASYSEVVTLHQIMDPRKYERVIRERLKNPD